MYAHATLWVDAEGRLCEGAPSRGLKIAAVKGDELLPELVKRYGLSESEGKIVQAKQAQAENKAVKEAPNKGGLSISRSSRRKRAKPKAVEPEPEPQAPEVEVEPAHDVDAEGVD